MHCDTHGLFGASKRSTFSADRLRACNPLMDKRLAIVLLRRKDSVCPLLLPNREFWMIENRCTSAAFVIRRPNEFARLRRPAVGLDKNSCELWTSRQ